MNDKNTMTAFEAGVWKIHNAGGVGFHTIASQLNRTENAVAAAWTRAHKKAMALPPVAPVATPVAPAVKLPPIPDAPATTLPKAIAGGRVIIPQGFFLVPKYAQIFPGDYFTTPARDVWQLTANKTPADQNPCMMRAYIRKIA